ncbi:FAD-dependent oxidoreductase [Fictibacillus sp. NRS-1165]|uniref:FAD-dependent oxidoreductase n=1 Tax=Fictibacillus sp. NRS-1165 TaxID=3144463 RepID=UPI003D1B3C89
MALRWDSAMVIGGGIAGLLAARVLSDFYGKVIIVEKDALSQKPELRPGTPQAFHPHRITGRGKAVIDRFFPDYEKDLVAYGAPSSLNKTIYQQNQYGTMVGQYPRNDIKFSRPVLEFVIRQRVRKIPNVQFLQKHDVVHLLSSPDRQTITGILGRDRVSNEEREISADLVVDTSGRSSKLPQWLKELGYGVPAPDRMTAAIGYSTRRYKLPSHSLHLAEKWDAIVIAGHPSTGTYHGVFSFIENNVAETLLYRPDGIHPPAEPEAYAKEIARLPSPLISEIVSELEPLANPRSYRVPALFRQHFEQMARWPEGLIVIGDAFCNFDPIFGQGMTVSAMEAEVLHSMLREQRTDPKPHFEQNVLQKIQDVITPAWWLNCIADLQWKGVEYEGSQPLKGLEFGKKFMDLYLKRATEEQDWKLYGTYWAVNTLSVSPQCILNPQTVTDVLSACPKGRLWLNELLAEQKKPLEELLDDILPSFHGEVFQPISCIH